MSAYATILTESPVSSFIHPKETYNQSLLLIQFLPAFDISFISTVCQCSECWWSGSLLLGDDNDLLRGSYEIGSILRLLDSTVPVAFYFACVFSFTVSLPLVSEFSLFFLHFFLSFLFLYFSYGLYRFHSILFLKFPPPRVSSTFFF